MIGAKAMSLIKGIDFDDKGRMIPNFTSRNFIAFLCQGVVLISDNIRNGLGIDVSTLMGANVANEVAKDEFTEATIGYSVQENGELLQVLQKLQPSTMAVPSAIRASF
jgi:glycerol-3-phosphate dehydrogenase (NAD+)